MPLRRAAPLLAAVLAACGSARSSPGQSGWRDVPGMICGDGSQTGIAISQGRPDAVLVYLAPGGACWSATSCDAEFKAFGRAEYELLAPYLAPGTVLDRSLPANPFHDWTVVFVPYCTGDVHAGDATRDHGGAAGRWHHHGFRNLQAAAGAFTGALPRPDRLVVAGSSAGGFGALAAYDLVRRQWDAEGGTTAALVDDSGPTFDAAALSTLAGRWWDAWGLGSTIGAACGGCASDLSRLWQVLHAAHPRDRLALISTTRDAVMIDFFADPALGAPRLGAETFEASLDRLAATLAALGPQVATFRAGGSYETEHALLASSYFLGGASGPALLGWLSRLVEADPAWASSTTP